MSLEGLKSSRTLRDWNGNIDVNTTDHGVKASWQLHGLFDPFINYKGWAIGGFLLGVWLAGTATGQSVVARGKRLVKSKK